MFDEGTIKDFLRRRGIEIVGYTAADTFEDWDRAFQERCDSGVMLPPLTEELHADPKRMLPEARSVIVFGVEYDGLRSESDPGTGCIAGIQWARKREKDTSEQLVDLLREHGHKAVEDRDIPQKAAAVRAGLAVQRKNSITYFPDKGSAVRLGSVVTDLELPTGTPIESSPCGECTICMDACPADALNDEYVLNVGRCLCYYTLFDQAFPVDLRPVLENRVLGCDICQMVCPYNKDIPRLTSGEVDWLELSMLAEEAVEDPWALKNRFFQKHRFFIDEEHVLYRTIAINLGNWGSPEARPLLERMRGFKQAQVAEAAEWASGRIEKASGHE